MKKFMIGLTTFCFFCGAYATTENEFIAQDTWHELTATEQSAVFIKGVRMNGLRRTFWVKYVTHPDKTCVQRKFFRDPTEEVRCDTKAIYEVALSVVEYELNCGNYKIRRLNGVDYNSAGKILSNTAPASKTWASIVPDTIAERFAIFLCRSK